MTRFTEGEVHRVLVLVSSDPHRMIDAIATAANPQEAVAALSAAFDLTEDQAALVLDQQLVHLTRSNFAALTEG
jgi:DNA gyrase/topoisomerase IV subunit A